MKKPCIVCAKKKTHACSSVLRRVRAPVKPRPSPVMAVNDMSRQGWPALVQRMQEYAHAGWSEWRNGLRQLVRRPGHIVKVGDLVSLEGAALPGWGQGAELRIYSGAANREDARDPSKAKATLRVERYDGQFVSGGLFALLGVQAQIGRTIAAIDDMPAAALHVVISDRVWRQRYGANPAVIGRAVRLNSQPAEIPPVERRLGRCSPAAWRAVRIAACH